MSTILFRYLAGMGFFAIYCFYLCSVSFLTIKKLTKQYDGIAFAGITDINFTIAQGDVVAVIGESGSGKSTLLKCIFGLLQPDSGAVIFEDRKVKGPNEQLVPGHPEMRMVTQDFSLNIYAKVYDNIASMLSNTNIQQKELKVQRIMEQLHITHLKDKKVIALSGGEQQRVAIARTLVTDIKVLLLDEPFSQVDALLKNELRIDLKRLAAEMGLTIIIVSHDPADGLFMSNQVLIIKEGRLIRAGTPQEIYNQPDSIYAARLLGNANVLDAAAAATIGIKTTRQNVVFYPEWAQITSSWSDKRFSIQAIYFKGFYEELLLERKGVCIRIIHTKCGIYKENDLVRVNISRFLDSFS